MSGSFNSSPGKERCGGLPERFSPTAISRRSPVRADDTTDLAARTMTVMNGADQTSESVDSATNAAPRTYLFALTDGGGTVPPEA